MLVGGRLQIGRCVQVWAVWEIFELCAGGRWGWLTLAVLPLWIADCSSWSFGAVSAIYGGAGMRGKNEAQPPYY